ncbi:esterase B1-like [Choristoneura fumiferana]|uniref:esterase B1-like n=1 Tax=Choristoneura fumiferana TaxID=7141 RepID=UPI003D15DD33
MILFELLCAIVILKQHIEAVSSGNPIVNTKLGIMRGKAATDGDYNMFLGIPYAKVNKTYPFGPALPYPRFESTFDAYDDSAICPQTEEFNHTIVGTLDCLHINIYVPDSASAQNPLPVFVWIYGGSFRIGFAGRFLYGPSFLVRHDVIVVTFNYRVGPYGFMCLDIPEVPGNEGLKDQILALRWIKENIGAFGGDAAKVTISGNSGGGMSADFHLHYGKEDLFKRIILQSGVIAAITVGDGDPTAPLRIADQLNYTTNDVKDALSYLSTVNPHDVIAAAEEAGVTFSPCIEKEFTNANNYVTVHPLNLDVPRVKDIDVLIGFNNDEMSAVYSSMPDAVFAASDFVLSSINGIFDFGDNEERLTQMREIVTHFYFGDEDITAELRQQVTDMGSDFGVNHGTLRTVKKYLDNEVENMYLYVLSYSGERNFVKHRLNLTGGGAAHADEIGYLFDISYMEKPLTPDDQLIVDIMTYLWANLAKYGNPTPAVSELVPIEWPRVTKEKWHYIDINTELEVSTRPFHDRMAFLDLFFKKNEQFQRGYEPEQEPSSAQNFTDLD